eukprot:457221-Amphidinium_carterae.1
MGVAEKPTSARRLGSCEVEMVNGRCHAEAVILARPVRLVIGVECRSNTWSRHVLSLLNFDY